ncbi:xyloglucan:xyloglucosyl transferase [Marchantia polymorpha subsp. ruderalis]|uniref:Xyloglucan endotransglucosylase/hydrolase n=2 Tax=Marchantia polymorpha TaxID=3197 RepID=A0A176W6Y2_MARPO|nr:hypothetical protein AXG93_684s1060 [Marchantia polymorpha subsp. ruderalis]PTQ30094.1 hypothetical protein MARPO_0130s0044 [Marchantia polymorpha]BBN00817.1 hypothetical protein Mp_2g02370 [Marchantia polymorpha subsp. ruderalis]|eukprot:PTQ30094.1 hypothetical protein MARPO_0130s0044 [Marchantia polymorpha]
MRTGSKCLLGSSIVLVLLGSCFGAFYEDFSADWGGENILLNEGVNGVDLRLTTNTGARFASRNSYLFGAFSVNMKLIAGNSAGTACSFYLTSYGDSHDEIDFEFLGNVSGQPYVLHTNVFGHGKGEREQRMFLWFDPTADFHNYSVIWNHRHVTWYVDNTPIRVFRNLESKYPNTYLNTEAQVVSGSIFDASTWATRGGLIPIDWNSAPFIVKFRDFSFNACHVVNNDVTNCKKQNARNWWEAKNLDRASIARMRSVTKKYRFYDYCTDKVRNPTPPAECRYNNL